MNAIELTDINADLGRRAVVATATMPWESSPSGTVWRKPLYRRGGEYGPVTSVVRYDAGGVFRTHHHPQGEEILVLEGVFSDEHGDYPRGTYLLNPDGSRHAPYSENGCTLLVRLRQYDGADRPRLALDAHSLEWAPTAESGIWAKSLYAQAGYHERMILMKWAPAATLSPNGQDLEIFVLEGSLQDAFGCYPQGSWIRTPPGDRAAFSSEAGCTAYVRRGALSSTPLYRP
jgi:anti-sigma factor ChrR (cupin superfamily)